MRIAKKIMAVLCMLAIAVALDNVTVMDAEAATTKTHTYVHNQEKGVAYPTAVRADINDTTDYFAVYLQNKGDYVASVKSNSSNLLTKIIMTERITKENSWYSSPLFEDFKYQSMERIGIFAKKPGTYQVTFTVKNAAKKKVLTKTVKIVVSNCVQITKLKYDGKDIRYTGGNLSKKAQGKLSVAVGKEYKLKKIEVGYYNADGTVTYKTTKNNKTIKLSTVKQYTEVDYSSEYSEYGTNYDYIYPETLIRLTIYDKELKITYTTTYSIFKK